MHPAPAPLQAKSVLNRVKGMPFSWSINPYRGCQHGCVFCYARRTHWFIAQDGRSDWSSRLFYKENAPAVLRRQLSARSWQRDLVALGTATDPYQPIEGRLKITRRILQALCDFKTPVSIVTRSGLILRDIDILADMAARSHASVAISICTLDADVARRIEPTVAAPAQRLRVVRELVSRGIPAGVLLAPVLPGVTDSLRQIRAVIAGARDSGATFVSHGVLYLGDVTRAAYFDFLRRDFPHLIPRYDAMYRGMYAPAPYARHVAAMMAEARTSTAFHSDWPRPAAPRNDQLGLFG